MPITPAIASPNWWANSTSRIQSVFFDSRMITASYVIVVCRVIVIVMAVIGRRCGKDTFHMPTPGVGI